MPRGPSTSKRQQGAANQRDTRHENGLVGPGKRVQKQKSNGHLNGHAKSPPSISSTPPLPASPLPIHGHPPYPPPADIVADVKMPPDAIRRSSVGASSDSSSPDFYHRNPGSPVVQESHRQIDVNAAKNPAVHRDSSVGLALTILRSCPLADTLAILIVLLQIPPTFLSMIHLLFATLTFVPPSTVASTMSFSDILQGTMGTPSITTIFFVDIFVLLVWLFLWGPLQDMALDAAQAVIALTLGGGSNGREAGLGNAFVCFLVIMGTQVLPSKNKPAGLRAILAQNALFGSSDPDDPLEPSSRGNKRHGLVRSILAIHILTQGVVRQIRDWYVQREKQNNSVSLGDPEAGKPIVDGNGDITTIPQIVDEASSSLPNGNPAISSKRKKKNSAQVRIRQPLWAALASTKIVMVKEYETSHTAAESAGTNATDMNNLGNAPFSSEAQSVWITYVGSDAVFFSASFFPTHAIDDRNKGDSSEIDSSKPFFVKVNSTVWQATKISATDLEKGSDTRWNGEIIGLAPTSSYQCEFISTIDGSVIFSTSIRTLASTTAHPAASLAPNAQVPARVESPQSTLKISIASAEAKLNDERNKHNAEKKSHKNALTDMRKKINKLVEMIQRTGGDDDKLLRRKEQVNLHIKQAEDAAQVLETQIRGLENAPSDDARQYSSAQREFQRETDRHKRIREELAAAKAAAKAEVETVANEVTMVESRVEKLKARISNMNDKCDSLYADIAKGREDQRRKEAARDKRRREREKIRSFYMERQDSITTDKATGHKALEALDYSINIYKEKLAQQTHMQETMIQESLMQEAANMNVATPSFPWGAQAYPYNMSAVPAPDYTFAPSHTPPGHRTRGRSSSILSAASGFTDDAVFPSTDFSGHKYVADRWSDAVEAQERKGSNGSGSGSSESEPKSPMVGNTHAIQW